MLELKDYQQTSVEFLAKQSEQITDCKVEVHRLNQRIFVLSDKIQELENKEVPLEWDIENRKTTHYITEKFFGLQCIYQHSVFRFVNV